MDFLQKAYGQVLDALRPMSAGAKVTTGLLLVVVVASLFYLFQHQGTSANAYLYGGRVLDDGEIDNLTEAFAKKNLNEWDVQGHRVRVPYAKRSAYLAAASEENAGPLGDGEHWDGALETGLLGTPSNVQKLREKIAMKRELERMLKGMTNVAYANVHFNSRQKPGLRGETEDHALIAIRTPNRRAMSGELVETVRNSSASALGMEPESVTVTDMSTGRAHPGGVEGSGARSAYLKHKQDLDDYYEKKIYAQLASYPGVIVNVNVDIESLMQHENHSVKFSDPTTFASETTSEEVTSSNQTFGGAPGVAANGLPNSPGAVLTRNSRGPDNSRTLTKEQNLSHLGREVIKKRLAPFTPTKITAAITLPDTYPLSVWKLRNPPAEEGEAKVPQQAELTAIEEETENKIQELVKNLLPPVPPGADPYPEIAVAFTPQFPVEEMAPPTAVELAGVWFSDNWQSVAMLGAALVGLLLLRGMIKSSQRAAAEAAALPLQLATAGGDSMSLEDDEEDEAEEDAVGGLRARFQAQGPNLQDELSEMVREDPDSAANVLRAWIGDAA